MIRNNSRDDRNDRNGSGGHNDHHPDHKQIRDRDIQDAIATNSVLVLQRLRTELIIKKRTIEDALGADKAEMMEDRAEMIERGSDLRDAVVRASAGTDFEWRRRASSALRITDKQISMINLALRDLGATMTTPKEAIIFDGTAEQLAEYVNNVLTTGGAIYAMTTAINAEGKSVVVLAISLGKGS